MSSSKSEQPPKAFLFERHPRLTILATLLIAFFAIELHTAHATELVLGYPLHDPPTEDERADTDPNKTYRQRSSLYHHDLEPNASTDGATWGNNGLYTVHTDSLGFKSGSVKSTPLSSQASHRLHR